MGVESFPLAPLDYLAIGGFLALLSVVGYLAGRGEQSSSTEYFLAGKKLPWYVVGGSFIASNISSEHFIGMIGVAVVYGVCVAMSEWGNVLTFTLLIWVFIPFLLASKVFTVPEFMERRFSPALRQILAVVTILTNVVAFLAAVLYGGALAIQKLFETELTKLTDMLPPASVDCRHRSGDCRWDVGHLWRLVFSRLDRPVYRVRDGGRRDYGDAAGIERLGGRRRLAGRRCTNHDRAESGR